VGRSLMFLHVTYFYTEQCHFITAWFLCEVVLGM